MPFMIDQGIISGLPQNPYRYGHPEGIVLHETGAWGGTAESNRNYELHHWQSAFVHYFVDWNSVVKVADPDYIAWGAGWYANRRFIHIELVRTRDEREFWQSYERYIWLAARLLHEYGLKPERRDTLWTHHDVTRYIGGTTHTDPDDYLARYGVTVEQLIDDITTAYQGGHVDYDTKLAGEMIELLLSRGDTGENVEELQKDLKELGYYGGNIDGDYGPKTTNAVEDFQRANGLSVDGIAGPRTLGKIKAILQANELHEWGKKAWKWATENGVTDGTRPQDYITREEAVVMLYRQEVK